MCDSRCEPCKCEPTSNIAVETIVKEMRRLAGEKNAIEAKLRALAMDLKDLE